MKLAALLLLGSLGLAAGCGRKAGGTCTASESLCANKTSALVCRDGHFAEIRCQGVLGCSRYQDHATCDDSVAEIGDGCVGDSDDEYACTADKRRALLCIEGRFALHRECRGKNGCTLLGRTLSCDSSIAARGDACSALGDQACTPDQKEMVACKDGKFATHRFCRGQFGCRLQDGVPACDESRAQEDDPCGLPGLVACALDGTSELICQGGRYARSRPCRKGPCTVTNRPGKPIECE